MSISNNKIDIWLNHVVFQAEQVLMSVMFI